MITYFDIEQRTPEWIEARRGILTASEMKRIITPSLKVANNDKTRAHVYEIAAQRITGRVDEAYVGDDMLRGMEEELDAKITYNTHCAPIHEVGFIIRDFGGFVIGYSPDGLVGDNGLIECKSRRQSFQVQTIVNEDMPDDYLIQVQTGLLVSRRSWCDFVSYSGGMPMAVFRILPDEAVQSAIVNAARVFEGRVSDVIDDYMKVVERRKFVNTERRVEQEMVI